ncbi:CHC2 zinc finger domain-containing protein [Embleya hyalina]|uniref:CHC2 zinc finger domain-containing protein n=1 Tax=Embleya hyalina TaxID=516124 RepID=UPI000F82EABF
MKTPKPPIADVFAHYYPETPVRGTGRWDKICCPVHQESRPSASINTDAQRWSCFVCDIAEDSWDVIMREESCDFPDAVRWAHSRFSDGSKDVSESVSGQPGRGVHPGSRTGQGGRSVRTRVRRFGSNWS